MTLPPDCVDGNLDERVCLIEDDFQNLKKNFKDIEAENFRLSTVTDELQADVGYLREEKMELQKNFDEHVKNTAEALKVLEEQILILSTRPCSCH